MNKTKGNKSNPPPQDKCRHEGTSQLSKAMRSQRIIKARSPLRYRWEQPKTVKASVSRCKAVCANPMREVVSVPTEGIKHSVGPFAANSGRAGE